MATSTSKSFSGRSAPGNHAPGSTGHLSPAERARIRADRQARRDAPEPVPQPEPPAPVPPPPLAVRVSAALGDWDLSDGEGSSE